MQHVHALQFHQDVGVDRNVQVIDVMNVVLRADLAVGTGIPQPLIAR